MSTDLHVELADGTTIGYAEVGDPDGPPVVYFHGNPGSRLEVDLPAVVTADLRLNEPRFVKMPDIMKAKRKPLDTMALADLGIDLPPALEPGACEPPPKRAGGVKVDSVDALVAALKDKGVLA